MSCIGSDKAASQDNAASKDNVMSPDNVVHQDKEDSSANQVEGPPSVKDKSQNSVIQGKSTSERSHRSLGSQRSRTSISGKSSVSSVIAMRKAEAQSARVELEYAKKEAELSLRRTQMDSEIKILETEKKIAKAEAEVEVLESADRQSEQRPPPLLLPYDDPVERVNRFVSDSAHLTENQDKVFTDYKDYATGHHNQVGQAVQLNPEAAPYTPVQCAQDYTQDLTRYLLRKDIVLSRLTSFNDKPECFSLWKAAFKSVMAELQCSPTDELDLLLKWLGNDSRRQALSIRKAHIHDPSYGLSCVWRRLEERYGSPEMVESSIKARLRAFPILSMKDRTQLSELSDLVCEIEGMMTDSTYMRLLSYFNSSLGVNQIVEKLPFPLQEKWSNHAFSYKENHQVTFPPFTVFSRFLSNQSRLRNDPSFQFVSNRPSQQHQQHQHQSRSRTFVQAARTDIQNQHGGQSENNRTIQEEVCPLHETRHPLNDCRHFQQMAYEDKIKFLKSKGICFKCCTTNQHLSKECTKPIQCTKCNSTRHCTAMHCQHKQFPPRTEHGGENQQKTGNNNSHQPPKNNSEAISAKCTQICGKMFEGKSCAKNILVHVYPKGQKDKAIKVYATMDDQSNASLCSSAFFDFFDIESEDYQYTISSCGGVLETTGRRASGFIIESLNGEEAFDLPSLIECDAIPNNKQEIPTPEVAEHHSHLREIAAFIPPLNAEASIHLLIGRDLPEAHHVLAQMTGPRRTPYAQKLPLGWVIIGETCLGRMHPPDRVNVNKLFTMPNGRPSLCQPCPNNLYVKENPLVPGSIDRNSVGNTIFNTTKDDDRIGNSAEDREFVNLMQSKMIRNAQGKWVAPLPFKEGRQRLPNNRPQALQRANSLKSSLLKDQVKKEHFVDFMSKILNNGHAEIAPPVTKDEECWYLPIFGVYHPRKPSQIRAVFDSSAVYQGLSLNSVLLQGPDLTNDLLGILIRFRREPVAIMADVQQMFYCFEVQEDHRNFLRFFWFRDNNTELELIEYRMKVHVFGNKPSPAVATFGLRKAAQSGEQHFGKDVTDFVENDFYVDDAVASITETGQAIDLLKRTKDSLIANGNIRLHKIVSNSSDVMCAFPTEDLANNLKDLDLSTDQLPMQRTLGISWDIKKDKFKFNISSEEKPFTRRGVLSTVNSIFDPIGFLAPVTIEGRMILRDLITNGVEWDDPLPREHLDRWTAWKTSIKSLENFCIPRMMLPFSLALAIKTEVHVFTDASEKAVAAAAYVKVENEHTKDIEWGFIMGKAKLAPTNGHTIPRLELCGAVLGVDMALFVSKHLDIPMSEIVYHTDSKIILGYISNNTRRFPVYVTNRVAYIRKYSSPQQWHYISTDKNPADQATRPISADNMKGSPWLLGPLQDDLEAVVQEADQSKEISEQETTKQKPQQETSPIGLGSYRFERFSEWKNLVRTISSLQDFIGTKLKRNNENKEDLHHLSVAERTIIRTVQGEVFEDEIQCLKTNTTIGKNSPIISLDPFIDDNGILRVGGRLRNSDLNTCEKNPVVIPGKHHIALLLVRHHHNLSQHQGRHFTEGAIRAAGLWIIGGRRLINLVIHKCVRCKMFRGKQESQKMADLPEDRIKQSPPFSNVGVDTFGPWEIVSRRTRGGLAKGKRWALLFTCLVTRAIHIEVIEEMSSSCFVNALRRFVAVRGNVRQFRSDRGTNFVGATELLKVDSVNVEDTQVKDFLDRKRARWIFNPPHSAHMGGAWERLIGVVKRILNNMMKDFSPHKFTHEVLSTFMCEVCAIVNARPITAVSSDPEDPETLSPSTLLTQKFNHSVAPLKDCQGDIQDLYSKQWKQVQLLADTFWRRFRIHYLNTLQSRSKWTEDKPNLQSGDIVLLTEKNCSRNEWPKGIVTNAIKSDDGKVRKASVKLFRDGQSVILTRPITELVVLLRADN